MRPKTAISRDFDFQVGSWRVRHRRLKTRLAGASDWEEFAGTSEMRRLLGGNGNVEDNWLDFPGGAYRAIALRSFDPAAGSWAIWWLDARDPHGLDVPVVGAFEGGVGSFFADVTHAGEPARLRFLWSPGDGVSPRWEQALSADAGKTWETNWRMDFVRA